MTQNSLLMAGVAAILIACAALLFTDVGKLRKQLRSRVLSTRELRSRESDLPEAWLAAQAKPRMLLRAASWLGFRDDLPAKYAAKPQIVVPLACFLGVVAFNLGCRVVPGVAAFALGIFVAILAARFFVQRKRRTYRTLLFKQIPDTMSLMLRAVRAGLPVAEAIRSVGRESLSPTREEFSRVAGEAALGAPIEEALRRLADRTAIQEYAFFSVIVGLHAQTGGNLSETLENMADLVRRRVAMAAKSKAMSAEGRLSAIVVGALPFAVGILTTIFNPAYLGEFLTNPNGPMLIAIFAGLLTTGMCVTQLLIQRSMDE